MFLRNQASNAARRDTNLTLRLFSAALFALAAYTFIPWLLARFFGVGVFRKGLKPGQIALTFDDGPHPVYTPQLLDLLSKYNVKATFFVVGSQAEAYPELVRRMHREGHQIGIHNYEHVSNWFMLPWTVRRRHVDRTANIVESITGTRPVYYRPPWGMVNLFDFWLNRQYKVTLWSLTARDWKSSVGKTKLKTILRTKMTEGSVVLLHDSGETFGADPDAPAHMIAVLDQVLAEYQNSGVRFVRIDEMAEATAAAARLGVVKRILVFFWLAWERCFSFLFRLKTIDSGNPLIKFRVREYKGKQAITLQDGEKIEKGDRIAELHFDNRTLLAIGLYAQNPVQLAIQLIRRTELLMPKILRLLQTDPLFRDVKGLYGITLIHRGSKQLGFTVVDLPKGFFSWMTRRYLRFLLYVIHPAGKERLKAKADLLEPKIVAISKHDMENRYIA